MRFASPQSKLENVSLKGNEFDIAQVKFDFNKYTLDSSTYTFDLIQKDEDGNIVGGETFVVEPPKLSLSTVTNPIVTSSQETDGTVELKVNNSSEFENIKWISGNETTLGYGETINVQPKINGKEYTVIATTNDGEVTSQDISIEDQYGIQSVSTANNNIVVNLKEAAPNNASVVIKAIADGTTKASCQISAGENKVAFDGAIFSPGIYVVCYLINSVVVDQQKVRIE